MFTLTCVAGCCCAACLTRLPRLTADGVDVHPVAPEVVPQPLHLLALALQLLAQRGPLGRRLHDLVHDAHPEVLDVRLVVAAPADR